MKKLSFVSFLCLAIFAASPWAVAAPFDSIKVTPYGVDYPLIRPAPYPSLKGEPFEYAFGVHRWLNPIVNSNTVQDLADTLEESENWFRIYGGYGVLGHGEDVFTRKAAHFRATHRGR